MIQSEQYATTSVTTPYMVAKLTDSSTLYTTMRVLGYKPLIGVKSQFTKKEYTFYPFSIDNDDEERYSQLNWLNWAADTNPSVIDRTAGSIMMGTKDLPYGLYEFNLYASTSTTSLDPTAMNRVWTGLMNLYAPASQLSVEYTGYEDNDTDNNVVYITN